MQTSVTTKVTRLLSMTMSRTSSIWQEAIPVTLHVYDVGKNNKIKAANHVLHVLGSGAYHAAIEVYGLEWSFAKCSIGTGVFWCEPTQCNDHQYREAIALGSARLSCTEIDVIVHDLSVKWRGKDYDPFLKNCCHFCSDFAK